MKPKFSKIPHCLHPEAEVSTHGRGGAAGRACRAYRNSAALLGVWPFGFGCDIVVRYLVEGLN